MRGVTVGLFKILQNQITLRSARYLARDALSYKQKSEKTIPPEISEAMLAIKKQPLPVPWEKLTKTLAANPADAHTIVYKSCLALKDPDITISYYKYLLDKGEHLSEVTLFTIVHMLSQCPSSKIVEQEDLIIQLYKQCKDLITTSEVVQKYGVDLFSYIPSCYRDLLSLTNNSTDISKFDVLIVRAFDFDDNKVWELLERTPKLTEEILNSFVRFCIRRAIQKEFSVDILNRFVDICQRRGLILTSTNILCTLQPLMHVLNHCQDDYIWSVQKCKVNPQMECLNCRTFLKKITLSESEFKSLKNALQKFVVLGQDVFLKTTERELNNFKFFLRNCRPYNIVVDGLNFLYRGIHIYREHVILNLFEKFVVQNKKKVLVIGRNHLRSSSYFDNLPDVQYFYTGNLSDDDIFTLYAAMLGGLGTGIATCDYFSTYAAKLDHDMRILFIKWQLTHQYMFNLKAGISPPSHHAGLPQCTESPETGGESYKWHLSFQNKPSAQYSFRENFNWVCLQATPKRKFQQKRIINR